MSVERVKITPSSIVLKDSSGNEKFNTSNLYLKTDPGGTLKAGGYDKAPMVYGQGTSGNNPVQNHDNGWFTSAVVDWTISQSTGPTGNLDLYVPKYDLIKLYKTPIYSVSGRWTGSTQSFTFNGVNAGTFRYDGILANIDGVTDGEGGYTYNLYVDIVIVTTVGSYVSGGPSGYVRFPPPSLAMGSWSRPLTDGDGNPYNEPFINQYRSSNKQGYYYYRTIKFLPMALMTTSDPVTLSIAVTP